LNWRSRGSSGTGLSYRSDPPRGPAPTSHENDRPSRRPDAAAFADDVQHYQKLLARHTRLELVEVREEQRIDGRIPKDAYVCLL